MAGAGYKVTKHGNYGVSSICGSSNVLEALGYGFTNDQDTLRRQLDKANICFLHAPLFHPALKSVGPIRKQLGVKTFFNILGPLVNPAQPSHQMVGVFSLKLARLYQYLFEELNLEYSIVHSLDGYDEISLTQDTKVISSNSGEYILTNEALKIPRYEPDQILGGDSIEDAVKIFTNVLDNKGSNAQKDVVIANAALGIDCLKSEPDLEGSLTEARDSLERGRAKDVFSKAVTLSQ